MMKPQNIFSQPVWQGKFPGRLDKLIQRATDFKTHKEVTLNPLLGKMLQVYNFKDNPHQWKELDEFNEWFAPFVQKIWTNWNYKFDDWHEIRFKSWVNFSGKGCFSGEHTHGNDIMTMIFYLNKEANTGNLQVLNPNIFHWQNTPGCDSIWEDVPTSSGDVVVIPGWMLHRVERNNTEEERISLVINATVIIKEGY